MADPRKPHVIQKNRHLKSRHPDRPETTYYAVGPARESLEQAYADLNDFLDRGSLSSWVEELEAERDALLALGRVVGKFQYARHHLAMTPADRSGHLLRIMDVYEALPARLRERLEDPDA